MSNSVTHKYTCLHFFQNLPVNYGSTRQRNSIWAAEVAVSNDDLATTHDLPFLLPIYTILPDFNKQKLLNPNLRDIRYFTFNFSWMQ